MPNDTTLEPAWQKVACPTCGMEHRDDCPNRYDTFDTEPCCEDGCPRCDYLGVIMRRVSGHTRFVPVQVRRSA